MSKFGTFGDYPENSLPSAEAALLTAWRSLDRYHNDLALVGGLAVHYLTKRGAGGGPHGAVTMDVDFGISLAASGHQSEADQDGPIRAAEFHPGYAEDRGRVRESTATVGRMLLGI